MTIVWKTVDTSRSRRRWLVCLVLDTAALGPAGGSGTAEETEVTRMVVPLQGNGLSTAGALRGTITTARGPAARRTARRWDAGADQHGQLARALEKERARGQSVEVHYSRRASQTGVRAGTKAGPRAGAELDGQSHTHAASAG
jgi:hypothetical protein